MAPLSDSPFARLDWSDQFPSESANGAVGRRSVADSPLSLADLTARVAVTVVEAVAIVEALCVSVSKNGTPRLDPRLDPGQILVHRDGSVTAEASGSTDAASAIRAIGHVLSELMGDSDFLLLRERVVSGALASPPEYSSIADFLHALQYYARPNGTALVQALYVRASQTPTSATRASAVLRPVPLATPPPRPAPVAPTPVWPTWRSDRRLHYGAASAAVVLIAGFIWAMAFTRSASVLPAIDGPSLFVASSIAPAGEMTAALRAVTSRRSIAGPNASAAVMGGLNKTAVAPSRNDRAVTEGTSEPSSVARLDERRESPALVNAAVASPEPVSTAVPQATAESDDPQLVPPRVLYPQSLDLLPPGSNPATNVLDVIVNEQGLVETAKSTRAPTTIGEFNAIVTGVSITKAWRFRPATLNGRPVKYRLLISLAK